MKKFLELADKPIFYLPLFLTIALLSVLLHWSDVKRHMSEEHSHAYKATYIAKIYYFDSGYSSVDTLVAKGTEYFDKKNAEIELKEILNDFKGDTAIHVIGHYIMKDE